MYNSYQSNRYFNTPVYRNDDRFFGGAFLGPFLLGGITGGLVSPLFFNNRPCCPNNYYYYPYPSNNYFYTYQR